MQLDIKSLEHQINEIEDNLKSIKKKLDRKVSASENFRDEADNITASLNQLAQGASQTPAAFRKSELADALQNINVARENFEQSSHSHLQSYITKTESQVEIFQTLSNLLTYLKENTEIVASSSKKGSSGKKR